MNSIETFARKAGTGIWGLDDILARGLIVGDPLDGFQPLLQEQGA
jgi:hypothetical protein